jgi:hypothetical protein
MASTPEILGIIQIIVVAGLLIGLVMYQPLLPQWVVGLLALYILIGFIQILASLRGNDKFYFLYAFSLGILLLVLYLYFVR